MTLLIISLFALICAAIPALMFISNLKFFQPPPPLQSFANDEHRRPQVSLLIPARNEEAGIENAVQAALQSQAVEIEIVVLDDHSTDSTPKIVQRIANSDSRVRLISGKPLSNDWNGKQHACFQLAAAATHSRLAFIDADVRLKPDALARMIQYQVQSRAALLSAFPRQVTGTWLEKWLIPLMHFILLGFLPFRRMRGSDSPAYAAGCGQFFMTTRAAYERAGTHASIRDSRHDGLKLPRAYRASGLSTDVIDGTSLAECRMYHSAPEVVRGLLKNAVEGIANPRLISPFTVMLIGGAVLPWLTLSTAWMEKQTAALIFSAIAIGLSFLPRALAAICFRQSWQGVLFHPLSLLLFVLLQWYALVLHLTGRKVQWRGRS